MSEADAIYRAFLSRRALPAGLRDAYLRAFGTLGIAADPLVGKLVEGGADLNAAELVLRRRDAANGLTLRARLMLTLAEADLSGQPPSWLVLAAVPLQWPWHWMKGTLALWRHGGRL